MPSNLSHQIVAVVLAQIGVRSNTEERVGAAVNVDALLAASNASTSDSARRAAREWMDTYHAAFKTNQEREDALAAIISKHIAPAPADNDAESVTLTIPTCGDCPFVDHSGAFTPGGAKAICGHRNAVETFAGDHGADWTYRQVDRDAAPPAQCPLRNPETTHVHEYHTIEGQSASGCKCGAVYNWPTTKGDR